MISRLLSVLAAFGLVASASAKVMPNPEAKALHTSTLGAQQIPLGFLTDGKTPPPTP